MDHSQKSFDPNTLAKLAGLELRARRVVEGYVSGMHRSPWHGFSVEFAEHREYVPGDDLRHVDWKVFGKTDKVYLKQYEQESNLICYLALDSSASMNYRSEKAAWSKWEYAQTAAASLGYLVLRQQDSAGLALFDEELRNVIRPAAAAGQWQAVLQNLEQQQPQGKSNIGEMLRKLGERWTRRGIIAIWSDCFDDIERILLGLRQLRHSRHDVILFHVLDPAELTFPFHDMSMFEGLENADRLAVDPRMVRATYLREFETFRNHLSAGCRELGCDYVLLQTDQPLEITLAAFLSKRLKRTAV
jgi:uncharacterized protein (DUF58 family)